MSDDYEAHTIYVCKSGRLYKIGYTKNLRKRLNNLSVGSASKIVVVHKTSHYISAATAKAYEELLHRRFAHRRVRGEWFDLAPGDLEWLGFFELEIIEAPVMEIVEASVNNYQDRYKTLLSWLGRRVLYKPGGARGKVVGIAALASGLDVRIGNSVYWCDTEELQSI